MFKALTEEEVELAFNARLEKAKRLKVRKDKMVEFMFKEGISLVEKLASHDKRRKMTEDDWKIADEMAGKGMSFYKIANHFEVCCSTITHRYDKKAYEKNKERNRKAQSKWRAEHKENLKFNDRDWKKESILKGE